MAKEKSDGCPVGYFFRYFVDMIFSQLLKRCKCGTDLHTPKRPQVDFKNGYFFDVFEFPMANPPESRPQNAHYTWGASNLLFSWFPGPKGPPRSVVLGPAGNVSENGSGNGTCFLDQFAATFRMNALRKMHYFHE